jgi:integrase
MNKVRVFSLQHRPDSKSPWLVKWRVDDRSRTRAFRTKAESEVYRSRLITASGALERFDPNTGEPASWARTTVTYAEVAQAHVARKWKGWSAASRKSYVEAVSVTVGLLTSKRAKGRPDRSVLSTALRHHYLPPDRARTTEPSPEEVAALAWLQRASLPVADISVGMVDDALDEAAEKLDGTPVAPNTLNRRRAAMNAVFERAVRHGLIPANPLLNSDWKAEAPDIEVDKKKVLSPVECRKAQQHLATLGTVGQMLSVYTAVLWLAGLRPSEATHLRVKHLTLPDEGWGGLQAAGASVEVGSRWTDSGERNDQKGLKWRRNGNIRNVPVPPELVGILKKYVEEKNLTGNDLLFVGPKGGALSLSTMDDYWRRTREALFPEGDRLRSTTIGYLRHTNASFLLEAGLSPTEVARRLGHSPDVCLRVYAGFMKGFEEQANARVDTLLSQAQDND